MSYLKLLEKLEDKGMDPMQIEEFIYPYVMLSEKRGRIAMEQELIAKAMIEADFIRHYDSSVYRRKSWYKTQEEENQSRIIDIAYIGELNHDFTRHIGNQPYRRVH